MLHFIFHFIISIAILGRKHFAVECFKTVLLLLLIMFIFPLSMKVSKDIFHLLSLPIFCVSLLFVTIINFASFPYLNADKTYYDLSHFSNHRNALYQKVSVDWICIRVLILWLCLVSCIVVILPLISSLLNLDQNLTLSFIKWIPFWIWTQLSLSAIAAGMLITIKNSFTLSCVISMPLSIPGLLLAIETSENLSYSLHLGFEWMATFLMSFAYLIVMPKLVDLLITKTNN